MIAHALLAWLALSCLFAPLISKVLALYARERIV